MLYRYFNFKLLIINFLEFVFENRKNILISNKILIILHNNKL